MSWARRQLGPMTEALFAGQNGPPAPERVEWVVSEADDFLRRSGARTRRMFRLAALAVSVLAPLVVLRFKRFGRMPLGQRIWALQRLEASRFNAPLTAVKALLSLLYYEHPGAASEIGFTGRCLRSGS